MSRWIKKNNLRTIIDDIRTNRTKGTIYRGLQKLAEGIETKEDTREWVDKEELEDGEVRLVKRKQVVKQIPPSVKAIETLARRYAPELKEQLAKSVTNNTVNLTDISFREVLEYNKEHNALDAVPVEYEKLGEYVECSESDVDDSEGHGDSNPPTRDSE